MSLSGGDFYFRGQVQTGFWQIQHPIRRERGFLLAGVSVRGITLNIYIYSVPKDKKGGNETSLRWPGFVIFYVSISFLRLFNTDLSVS